MTVIGPPRDPFSQVVDEKRRWDPEWYQWLSQIGAEIQRLSDANPAHVSGAQFAAATFRGAGGLSASGTVPGGGGGGTSTKGAPVIWGDTTKTTQLDGSSLINALAYAGVDPTGVVDSRAGLQAAWDAAAAAHKFLYVPSGTYKLASTSTQSGGGLGSGSITACLISPRLVQSEGVDSLPFGGGIVGDGPGFTVFNVTVANTAIAVRNIVHGRFQDFTITRPVAVGGGYGIDAQAEPTGTTFNAHICDKCLFRNLHLLKSGVGIIIGGSAATAGFNIFENIISEFNVSYGFQMCGEVQMYNCYAALNGSHGFFASPNINSQFSCGQWRGLSTFQNGGYGFFSTAFAASVAGGVSAIRVSDSFFGSDALGVLYLDTYGIASHIFTNVFAETNVNTNTCTITANNPSCYFDNCYMTSGGVGNCINSVVGQFNGSQGMLQVRGGYYSMGPGSTGHCITLPGTNIIASISGAEILNAGSGVSVDFSGTYRHVVITGCRLPSGVNLGTPSVDPGVFMLFGNTPY